MARLEEARTLVEKCRFITELEEGEEFEVIYLGVRSNYNPYQIIEGQLFDSDKNNKNDCVIDKNMSFKRLPWKPTDGDMVYFVDASMITRYSGIVYNAFFEKISKTRQTDPAF